MLYALIPRKALFSILILSALFFILAADVKFHGPISRINRPISQTFLEMGLPKSIFLAAATDLGGGAIVKLTWTVTFVLLIFRRWHYIPALWFSVTLGGALNGKMQKFFAVPRPIFPDVGPWNSPGFPSGHTVNAVLLFGFLVLVALKEFRSREAKVFTITFCAGCAVFVGYTRAALLVHNPTDVLGSFLWGPAWLIGCYYGNILGYRWSAKNLQKWDAESAELGAGRPAAALH